MAVIPKPVATIPERRLDPATLRVKAEARDLNFYYGNFHALKNLNIPI